LTDKATKTHRWPASLALESWFSAARAREETRVRPAHPDPVIDGGRVTESGPHRDLLREGGLYASLYQEQFEGGQVQWRCPDGDIMTDGTVRPRDPQPTKR
jgi:hypothetical protein